MRKAEFIGSGLFAVLLILPFIGESSAGQGAHAPLQPWSNPHVLRDLPQIEKDTLRVLVLRDPLTWEKRPRAMTGLEWELLERFARHQHLAIKACPVEHRDSMLLMLQQGRGDVIAAQLTPSCWAAPFVDFTRPYRSVAGSFAKPWAGRRMASRKAHDLPDTLEVSSWSPFLDSLKRSDLADSSTVLRIVDQRPAQLLEQCALGRVPALLVTDATAKMEAKRLPLVVFAPALELRAELGYAVRTNAAHLLQALNAWLALPDEAVARKALFAAYDNGLDTRGPMRSFRTLAFGGDTISPYDSLFQVHADSLPWDWKLLAAVAFKESGFDTAAVSYAGAGGLMQMMPATAALMGVTAEGGINGHIKGASRYLDRLDRIWRRQVKVPGQRLKFVLASYNAGPGHVKDAQRLAKKLGLDPSRWDGNVERAIVLLNRPAYFTRDCVRCGYCRGQDTFWYVRDVMKLYSWLNGKREQGNS